LNAYRLSVGRSVGRIIYYFETVQSLVVAADQSQPQLLYNSEREGEKERDKWRRFVFSLFNVKKKSL